MVLLGAGIGEEVDEGEDNDAWKIWCAKQDEKTGQVLPSFDLVQGLTTKVPTIPGFPRELQILGVSAVSTTFESLLRRPDSTDSSPAKYHYQPDRIDISWQVDFAEIRRFS
ncbi:hypothetical protein VKT23_010614 [Stygiomarasmius scandens]|uniref:Uncharacterized protein n=1 Tax=Marasmiellus scandens TaxID=2682957 RepID=A0ABR1JEV5_9AGAR